MSNDGCCFDGGACAYLDSDHKNHRAALCELRQHMDKCAVYRKRCEAE